MGRRIPRTAAEFLSQARATDDPPFDAWPPANWFTGEQCRGGDGMPFDWSCPAAGFGVEAAYDWVGRVASFYRHLEATDTYPSRHNGPHTSGLNNAYLLVDDLRARRRVPLGGFRIYRVRMDEDDVPFDFESRELGVIRDWLGRQLSTARRVAAADRPAVAAAPTTAPRLRADPKAGTVTVDGVTHHVGDIPTAFVQALVESRNYVSLAGLEKMINELFGLTTSNLTRVRDKLPKEVKVAIEIHPQCGHRIRPEFRK